MLEDAPLLDRPSPAALGRGDEAGIRAQCHLCARPSPSPVVGSELERALELAYYDGLTRLPNRVFLRPFLEQSLAAARRNKGCVAVLVIDLDGFKRVNDSLGHRGGDELLREVANRIGRSIRASDTVAGVGERGHPELGSGAERVAARVGGDEFVVALTSVARAEDAAIVAKRIADQLAVGIQIGSTEVFVSSSIGIATFPENADDVDTLLDRADEAMYQAKESGRNRFQFYTASMQEAARAHMDLENRFRAALVRARIVAERSSYSGKAHCEFHLAYQPKIELPGGRVTGAEALLRWECPTHGAVPPSDFIRMAEQTGLIVPLGAWILKTACLQAKRWAEDGPRPLRVSVNASSRQLRERNFASLVATTLRITGLDPSLLEIEITESVLMGDAEVTHENLAELKRLGVHIALDDFGTGYSSLSYLTKLPIGSLKIDRSFIQGCTRPGGTAKVTAAIISLARSLGIGVVAEGVETEAQLAAMSNQGPIEIQGFLVARPMAPDALTRWLEASA